MDIILNNLGTIGTILLVLAVVLFWKAFLWLFGIIIVPDDSLGTVTKKFVIFGANSNLPDGQIIALEGEAGYQADTLSPGLHLHSPARGRGTLVFHHNGIGDYIMSLPALRLLAQAAPKPVCLVSGNGPASFL